MKNLLLLIIISLYCCNNDNSIKCVATSLNPVYIPTQNCITIPDSPSQQGYDFLIAEELFVSPVFNPINPNEFAYVIKDGNNTETRIAIYNLNEKCNKIIYKGIVTSHLEWTINNWIVFTAKGITKIKPDGSSLTVIAPTDINFTIKNRGTQLMYKSSSLLDYKYYIIDLNGKKLDSIISINGLDLEWNNEKVLFSQYDSIILYNTQTKEKSSHCQEYNLIGISKCLWISENKFIWSNKDGLFKTDISTNSTILIKNFCNAFKYNNFNYIEESNSQICQKITRELIGQNLLKININIVMMAITGENERIITLEN